MNLKNIMTIILSTIVIQGIASSSHGYAEQVHKAINKVIIQNKLTTAPLKDYFKLNLGYSSEKEFVDGKTIIDWFENAGAQEDMPPWRTPNHFLDPLTNQGFSGFLFGLVAHGKPTAEWAQMPPGQQSNLGSYSWRDAREYFYNALTSTTKQTREKPLAESFRALGQVMHLVEDMSVPEHKRDTGHVGKSTIESWLEKVLDKNPKGNPKVVYKPDFDIAVNNPTPISPVLLQNPGVFPNAPLPIANLFDYEKYTTSSSSSVTISEPTGLSEYTNANFSASARF